MEEDGVGVQGKSCHNCKNSRTVNKMIDCLNPDVNYKLLDKYKKNPGVIPQFCGHYEPKMVKKCFYCDETIHHPVYTWRYWVEDVFEDLPVCSRRCQEELQAELDHRTDNFSTNFTENEDENDDYPF